MRKTSLLTRALLAATSTMHAGELTPAAFEEMALGFADRAVSHDPSWAWVPASDDGPLAPAVGFLRSASILVPPPPPVSGDDPAPLDVGLIDESVDDDDDAAAVRASPSAHRLELHIVCSCADTYAPGPPYCTYTRTSLLRCVRTCGTGQLARHAACAVRVPAPGVPYVPRTVAPQVGARALPQHRAGHDARGQPGALL